MFLKLLTERQTVHSLFWNKYVFFYFESDIPYENNSGYCHDLICHNVFQLRQFCGRIANYFSPFSFHILYWTILFLLYGAYGSAVPSSVVCALASRARCTGINPRLKQENFRCANTLSFVSFADMTWKQCAVVRIGTLTGGPCAGKVPTLCRLKNPSGIQNGYL